MMNVKNDQTSISFPPLQVSVMLSTSFFPAWVWKKTSIFVWSILHFGGYFEKAYLFVKYEYYSYLWELFTCNSFFFPVEQSVYHIWPAYSSVYDKDLELQQNGQ